MDVQPRRSNSAYRTPDMSTLAALGSAADEAVDFDDRDGAKALAPQIDLVLAAGVSISPGWPHFFPRIPPRSLSQRQSNARDHLDEAMADAGAKDSSSS